MKKERIASVGKLLQNVLEVYIPAFYFIVLFASFLLGVIFRYVLKDPQSWTFELSSICYLGVGVMSWGIAHRTDENVVFDMLYTKLSEKVQCVFRIITNVLITATAALLIMPAINYLLGMRNLQTDVMRWPRYIIFLPFVVSFVAAVCRSAYRLVLDVKGFARRQYRQQYGKQEETQ